MLKHFLYNIFIISNFVVVFPYFANSKQLANRYDDYSEISYKKKTNHNKKIDTDDEEIKQNIGFYKVGKPYKINGKRYIPKIETDYSERGIASWYGERFHKLKTANGEIYDMNGYTAAHRTLPLPSVVKITNLKNGKSIKVKVNDRGPFRKNRIIDVSKQVAKELGFFHAGTALVQVQYLEKETNQLLKEYGIN